MLRFLYCCFFLFINCNRLCAATLIVMTGDGGNFFSPAYFVINPGDTVKWVWKDGHHNTSSYSVPAGGSHWYANLNSTETGYMFVPTVSGLYQYTCTHHSGMDGSFFVSGCSFPDKPIITGVWESSPCAGGASIILRTSSQTGATYQWIKGGTMVAGANAESLKTSSPGVYIVLVNRCGVDSLSPPYTVPAYPLPLPAFNFIASGLLYNFTNTTPALSNYLFRWNFDDGTPGFTGTDATHSYSAGGAYDVTLHISDSSGACMDSTIQTIKPELGLNSIMAESVSVFPNPAATYIEIRSPEDCTTVLCDVNGLIILAPFFHLKKQQRLDLQGVPAGSYLLKGYGRKGELFTKRIIVY